MNICIPVEKDIGIHSPVCQHFGSAPMFMIVETDSWSCRAIPNRNLGHQHGMCQPLTSLQGERLDGMVVGGIGAGALNRLLAGGIKVFLSEHGTVEETMKAFKAGTLRPVTPDIACAHHATGKRG
jgi:predicted Fe-Mo cluster-binding NifX family protein